MRELLIISPCFYPNGLPAELMVDSARRNGLDVLLYGIGEQFIPHGAQAQVKDLMWLMKYGGKKADYALICDCRDVLFQGRPLEIMGKFDRFEKDIVMSAEPGCWPPDPEIIEHYYGKDSLGYNYVNAGLYMGKWEYIVSCLEWLMAAYDGKHPGANNSQGWWMWAKMRGELDFALDSGCQLFQSMSGGSDGQINMVGRRAMNTLTGTFPCVLHYNGNPGVIDPHAEMYRRLFA